jgi:hypothetical protein
MVTPGLCSRNLTFAGPDCFVAHPHPPALHIWVHSHKHARHKFGVESVALPLWHHYICQAPPLRRSEMSGFRPHIASKGVRGFPLTGRKLETQATYATASVHKECGPRLPIRMHRARSLMVRTQRSAAPFCSGVPGQDVCILMPRSLPSP